jgi:hypothetical protein
MDPNQTPNPPAAGAILPQWAVIALTALVGLAGVVLAVSQTVAMPAWVPAVAGGITGIGAMFGIMSPGVRRAVVSPPSNVVTLEQAAAELRKGPPAP